MSKTIYRPRDVFKMAKVMILCLVAIVIVSARAYVMRNARISRSASAPEMCSGGESAASRKKSILGRSVKRLGATTDKSRQAPRTKKSLKNLIATSREDITPEEQARLEWEELEKAASAAGDTFQDALQAKLDGWKRLTEEGVLDKIDETFSEDDIREIDELSERLTLRGCDALVQPELLHEPRRPAAGVGQDEKVGQSCRPGPVHRALLRLAGATSCSCGRRRRHGRAVGAPATAPPRAFAGGA